MALSQTCTTYAGRTLLIEPIYGHGWRRHGSTHTSDYPEVPVPAPFHVTVSRMFSVESDLIGGIGLIEEKGHELEGSLASFQSRHLGEHNFRDHLDDFVITVGSEAAYTASGVILAVRGLSLVGFGVVRDDAR